MSNRTSRKYWKVGVACILLLLVIGAVYFHAQARTIANMATMVSRLGQLRTSILLYHQNHGRFPDTLDDLGVGAEDKKDPLAGQNFTYTQPQEGTLVMPMVVQPVPFRTRLWPFGEMRQYGFFADGEITVLRRD